MTLGPANPKLVPDVAMMRSAFGTALADTPPHTLPSSTANLGQRDPLLEVADCFDHARHLRQSRKFLVLAHAARGVDAHEGQFLADREVGGRLKLLARHHSQRAREKSPVHGVEHHLVARDGCRPVGR